jgi:hypothetical protein
MSTHDATTQKRSRQRWLIPAVALLIGVVYLVAGWLGADLSFGVVGLLIMTGTAIALLVLGHYSETVAGLLDRRDERINSLDMQASMVAGMAVIAAVIAGFVIEIARGQDGSPYSMLGAIGGGSYVIALVVLRLRK